MAERSFRSFVEQELGWLPFFFIYAVLEWTLIIVLFLDGTLSFLADGFAKFFELKTPCLLCTRIDHLLVQRTSTFFFNDSICETHKKDLSALAYCHAHRNLSNVRKMCDRCLLSFATGKEADCGTYKTIVRLLHKDVELFANDNREIQLAAKVNEGDASMPQICSCCKEPLKAKSNPKRKNITSQAPAPSPRAPSKLDGLRYFELPDIKFTGIQEDDDGSKTPNSVREDAKTMASPLLEPEDINEDRTPTIVRSNKFFGIPLNDSASNTPRWMPRRKSPLERTEHASESGDANAEGDSILQHLKRQVNLDRKSLIAMYMELDEERSASAVAANNAMAMITRLQAEKAAVQMEALQYQRMMEEQAEYDQEALQETNMLLAKRDEEIKDLTAELEMYRTKYGVIEETSSVGSREELWETKSSFSYVERSECATPTTYKSVDDEQSTSSFLRGKTPGFLTTGGERVFNSQLTRIHEMVKSLRSYNEVLEQGEILERRSAKKKALLAEISGSLHQLMDVSALESN